MGEGTFLKLLLEKGFKDVYGVELSPVKYDKAVANLTPYLKNQTSTRIINQDMHQFKPQLDQFDLVIMHHSLEHAYDPYQVLENVYSIMGENALFWGIVPYEPNNKIGGNGNAHTFPFLSKEHVTEVLEKSSFHVEQLEYKSTRESEIHFVALKVIHEKN